MKTTRHSLLAKGLLILLSLLILIFAFTYTWFYPAEKPVDSSGIKITTSAAADFDIRIGYTSPSTGDYILSDWLTGTSAENVQFRQLPCSSAPGGTIDMLADFKPIDLTSDGRTFIRPDMRSKNIGINLNKNTYEYAVPNQQYISFDLIVRSHTSGARIKLGTASTVLSKVETEAGGTKNASLLVGDSFGTKQSSYGEFNEDSVVGAVRVSFVGYDSLTYANIMDTSASRGTLHNEATLLWIPRTDMFLKATDNTNDWTLVTGSSLTSTNGKSPDSVHLPNTTTDTYTCLQLASTHYYYGIFESATPSGGLSNYKIIYNVNDTSAPSGAKKLAITDLNDAANRPILTASVDNNDTYYYSKCQVNIWVDGCDAEARRAVDGGQFYVNFDLASI